VDTQVAPRGGVAATQLADFEDPLDVVGTDYVELLSVDVSTPIPSDIILAGHVYLEKPGGDGGRYYVKLAQDTCDGSPLGLAFWRPAVDDSGYVGDTVHVTGLALDVDGASTVVLCSAKINAADPDVTAYTRGMTATW